PGPQPVHQNADAVILFRWIVDFLDLDHGRSRHLSGYASRKACRSRAHNEYTRLPGSKWMQVDSGACRGHGIWWNIAGFVGRVLDEPTRSISPVWSTRSSLACRLSETFAISSSKRMN